MLVALALVLAFFVIDGGQNWDRVGRFFSYGTQELQIALDAPASALGELDGQLVTAGADGVTLYDKDGKVRFSCGGTPGCSGGPGTGGILAYDAGSTLLLLNQKGEICSNPTLAGAVYDADLTEDGYCATSQPAAR